MFEGTLVHAGTSKLIETMMFISKSIPQVSRL